MFGTLTLILALLFAAMVLFALEVLTPSFGLLAVLGVGALIGAVWVAFAFHAVWGWTVLVGSLVLTPVYIVYLVKRLPKSAIGKRLFLQKVDPQIGAATPEAETMETLVGRQGVAATALRPSGFVRIDSKRVPALAESGMIDAGQSVRVIKAGGTDVVVRLCDEQGPQA